MKKKSLISMFVACLMSAVTLFGCGASTNNASSDSSESSSPEDEVVYVEDDVMPISLTDNFATDKVVTSGFAIGDATEDAKKFDLPYLVGHNMLLQANMTTRVWGKTKETGAIAAQIINADGEVEGTYYSTITDGSFLIYLGAHDYGRNYKLKLVTESGYSVTLINIAFGELWIGGGQSNMGWAVGQCYDGKTSKLLYQEEITNSMNSNIRLFHVAPANSQTLVEEVTATVTGGWSEARPQVVAGFSAAAYFFAKELNAQYDIPVGVLVSCMGGTGVQEWMPPSVLEDAVLGESPNMALCSRYYNAMIYPIRNVVARGVLWYQGEGDNNSYDVNYGVMMRGWRETFGKDNLWFTTITLPRYTDYATYFDCREQQKAASIKDQYATYSVNIDCGLLPKNVAIGDELNPSGIHPYDKEPIGARAAHVTMQDLYGAKGTWSSPTFKSAEVVNGKLIVTFDNVGKGLVLQGNYGFEIANDRAAYVPATVKVIAKNKVEISAPGVDNPAKARYGFMNNDINVIESYAECVCLYSTKGDDNRIAYPAEQFIWTKDKA